MSIDRQRGGKIIFECDGCDEIVETNETDFETALAIAKEAGFRVTKYKGEWMHFCSTCKP